MKVTKIGDWSFARRLASTAQKRLRDATDKAVLQEAQFFRTKIVEGIREQAPGGKPFQPLAPTTLAIRRFRGFKGTKALVVQGDLRNSITVVKEPGGAFVGVRRTAKGADGRSLVNVGEVHEFGSRPIVVKLTPKARRFLHAAFRRAGLDQPACRRPTHDGDRRHQGPLATVPATGLRALRRSRGGLPQVPRPRRAPARGRLREVNVTV